MLLNILRHPLVAGASILFIGAVLYTVWNNYKDRKIIQIAKKICNKMNDQFSLADALKEIEKESDFVFYTQVKSLTEIDLHITVTGIHKDTSYDIYIEKDEYPSADKKENEWILKKLTTTVHKEQYDKITT